MENYKKSSSYHAYAEYEERQIFMHNEPKTPKVSVIMPVYNESNYIKKCIDSLLEQDYPIDDMEWVFVDGMSEDDTKKLIGEYIEKYPSLIRVYDNPDKTVPYAMNIGIQNTVGKYIVRLDAHAEYQRDYITQCVRYLDTTDADNVGGVIITKARTKMGGRIARMLSSRFGVGNANFRVNGNQGYVDTVPFGAFRREVFENYGLYDERLTRNQDNEMNWRIRKNGGKIYLSHDIKCTYYCRDTIKGISQQAYGNGKWNVITMYVCPGSMGVRHFVPFAFLCSLIVMRILSALWWPFAILFSLELGAYLLLDALFSVKLAASIQNDSKLLCALSLLMLFPIFHVCYGFGSLIGILTLHGKNFKSRQNITYKAKKETERETDTVAR